MGKRKNKAKVQAKTKARSSTIFNCPLCDNQKCVEVSIKKEKGATLKCRMCNTSADNFPITNLTIPIDIYSYWIDSVSEKKGSLEKQPVLRSTYHNDSEDEE